MLPLFYLVKNWHKIPLLFFGFGKTATIDIGDIKFNVRHFSDLLTIKEIYINDDYGILKLKPKIVVDIGANIGTFSLLCNKNKYIRNVYSFEPDPLTYSLLEQNIKQNFVKKIKTFRLAVNSRSTVMNFYSNAASGLSSLYNTRLGTKQYSTQTITLQEIFIKNNLKQIDYLKVDCEGGEYDIFLKSADRYLKGIKQCSIEYHDSLTSHHHNELVKRLKKVGFTVSVHSHPIETDIGILYAKR